MAIPIELSTSRPECCEFAFGRAFYAYDSTILFSQLIENQDFTRLGKCYSVNDPTAEVFNAPLDTDGGVIEIQEASRIMRIFRLGPGIIVMAENGIWYIGGPETGWKPTSFSIQKVSNHGLVGKHTAVVIQDTIYYWSSVGVHVLAFNEFNTPREVSLTEASIKTFYQSLPGAAKEDASVVYDSVNQQIEWLYYGNAPDTPPIPDGNTLTRADRMTHGLIYDIRLQAWYPQRYQSYDNLTIYPYPHSISHAFELDGVSGEARKRYLYVTGGTIDTFENNTVFFSFAYPNGTSFREFDNTSSRGLYESYLQTAHENLGTPSNKKQAHHMYSFFQKTETHFGEGEYVLPSSCHLQLRWDWNTTSQGNKWEDIGEIYKFRRPFYGNNGDLHDDGESIVQTKTKLRGRGNALSMRFVGQEGKDFQLLGYATAYEASGRL